jgi:FMN-dependent oxidoreductase (nitrilotriacetate monooxygenase family)
MAKKMMHLTGFVIYCPAPHTMMSWIYPRDKIRWYWHQNEYWRAIAQTLERGKFDMMFFADGWGGGNEASVRYAVQFPNHDPLLLISYLAGFTQKLGFAVTMSTTFYAPFMLARKLSTLDHITNGRIGWNIVTSFGNSEARNFGMDGMIPHDERYERADEFMEVCYRLWDSWEPDAVKMDMENGIFADPKKVHRINFHGKWFNCQGPLDVIPSPQRRPFLIQAGASERGREFAARHAECVFGAGGRWFSDDLAVRAQRFGRKPEDIKIIWGAQPIVAETESEAQALERAVLERIPPEAGLSLMSSHFDTDLSRYDMEMPLERIETAGVQGILEAFKRSGRNFTLREAAKIYGRGIGMPHMVGTPQQVADQMESMLDHIGGDGFQISPPYYAPDYYDDLVRLLIPELQRRGVFRKEYEGNTLRDYLCRQ